MAKEIENFEKYYKAFQKDLKTYSSAAAEKKKKDLLGWLDKTWAKEDAFSEAIEKARLSGVTGSKAADFIKLPDCAKPLTEWKKAVATHHNNIEQMTTYFKEVRNLFVELEGRCNDIEALLKKKGSALGLSMKEEIKLKATIKEARRYLPDLRKAEATKLPGHAVMYATHLQQTVEVLVKQALKKVDPKELPKQLDEADRKKTLKLLKDGKAAILRYSNLIRSNLEGDLKKAQEALKSLDSEVKALESLDDICKDAAKKMKKEIAANTDQKAIEDVIKKSAEFYKRGSGILETLKKQVHKATVDA